MRNITLTCLAGPLKSQVFHLDYGPVFIFGRYGKADFSLAADPAVSHLHFLIDISEDRVRIVDLGSTNGLVINDRHVGGKQGESFTDFVHLKSGDTVLAGSCLFRLAVENESATLDPLPENDVSLPVVDGYSIIGKVGGGGKGVVYRAVRKDTGATVAIKMMLLDGNKTKKRRTIEAFRREIQITRQLDHPNIIRWLGDGVSLGAPYLVLEYAAGGNLDELIRRSPRHRMDLPRAIPLFIQILEAVGYMHDRRLVHRDIKPKNILLDPLPGNRLSARLSDMGLSCRFSNLETNDFFPVVSEGGTLAYMPPEQLTDLTRAIPQSDVFSSAATLYHMLTGALPYDFTPDHDQNEVIIECNIKPIEELRPDLPDGIVEIVATSLSPKPENRYADAHEMLDAFRTEMGRVSGGSIN